MEVFIALDPAWKRDDVDSKLQQMGNRIKHYGETTGKDVIDVDKLILPLWFRNEGLVSVKGDARTRIEVSYTDLAKVVRSFAELADTLQDPAPSTPP